MTEYFPRRPLPPLKLAALRDLRKGRIIGTWAGGWTSEASGAAYNTHSIEFLSRVGWARLNRAKTRAEITAAGMNYLTDFEGAL